MQRGVKFSLSSGRLADVLDVVRCRLFRFVVGCGACDGVRCCSFCG